MGIQTPRGWKALACMVVCLYGLPDGSPIFAVLQLNDPCEVGNSFSCLSLPKADRSYKERDDSVGKHWG